jgi:predicted TIM-barrel fold metal-dependent hydrolase
MIIDMHMHVDSIDALGWHMTAEQCVSAMDEAGIDKAVIMTITDLPEVNPGALEMIAAACSGSGGRLHAFARIHPWYAERACDLLRRAVQDFGFVGLKLHPVSSIAHPAGAQTIELVRVAAELGVPTLFHCADEPMTTPLSILPLARACPDAKIILGHMGGYFHVEEALIVAELADNIVLETSAVPYPAWINAAVRRVGSQRVLFGSDGPVCSPLLEVEKVRQAGLSEHDYAAVMGGAAADLLGWAS